MTSSFLIALAAGLPLLAQMGEEPVVLTIEVENHVPYRGTVADPAQFGTTPGPVPTPAQIPFVSGINVGDIVAINGTPVRGIWSSSFTHTTAYRRSPQPGNSPPMRTAVRRGPAHGRFGTWTGTSWAPSGTAVLPEAMQSAALWPVSLEPRECTSGRPLPRPGSPRTPRTQRIGVLLGAGR